MRRNMFSIFDVRNRDTRTEIAYEARRIQREFKKRDRKAAKRREARRGN